jgi:S-adenosylmethionine:tRNA ribosyltransferase-isomerase
VILQKIPDISISDYSYELPEELIALHPLEDRARSRLLIYRDGEMREDVFSELPRYLPANSHLVFNASRVIPARLVFTDHLYRRVEVFCLEPAVGNLPAAMAARNTVVWNCLVGHLKRWKHEALVLKKGEHELRALKGKTGNGMVQIKFEWSGDLSFGEALRLFGTVPLPPYIKRDAGHEDIDRYQTVYAGNEGSVAAPTAGLHFTAELRDQLKEQGHVLGHIVLHVSGGTFQPVKSEKIIDHPMHGEWLEVEQTFITQLLQAGNKIIAVGTTSLRTLESLYWMGVKTCLNPDTLLEELEIKQWDPYHLDVVPVKEALEALNHWMVEREITRLICRTSILICPPYRLKLATGLVTNFHQPKSTLLLLIAAVAGPGWRKMYNYAVQNRFRFLSYGDSSLIL